MKQISEMQQRKRAMELVERIAKMTSDADECGRWLIPFEESVQTLNEIIMDARNIVDGQEG